VVGDPIDAAVGVRRPGGADVNAGTNGATNAATNAREEVLARVRTALAGAPDAQPVPRRYRAAGEHLPGSPELLDLLAERLVDYKASVLRCDDANIPATVSGVLAERGLRRVAAPAGVPGTWLDGAEILRDGEPGRPPVGVGELDGVDAVVTGCAVAVAETGTIVLDAGPEQGRRVLTLVPDVHVVVVRAGQVVQTVPEGLARLDPHRPLTLISGPSATSDIELDRVEGVHGPRTLVVVLVALTAGPPST
jgi:L-lactate dehydrogenase complex protein LldG